MRSFALCATCPSGALSYARAGPARSSTSPPSTRTGKAAITFARRPPGVERIILWGTSYGGGHALALAAEMDGLAGVLAQAPMADGRAAARGVGPRQLLRLAAHGLIDEARRRLGLKPHTIPITGEVGELALLTTPDAAAGLAILNPDAHPWPNEVGARIALRAGSYRPGRHADRIACPLLVVVCEDDVITPPAPATEAARRAPRGELLSLPGGHYAVYEGEGFDHAITAQLAFLERCTAPSGRHNAGRSTCSQPREAARTSSSQHPVMLNS